MRRLNTCALALAGAGALGFAGTANAAVTDTVRAGDAVDRSCHVRLAADGAKGVDTTEVTADKTGLVRARLSGRGDWDVGVFDAKTGRSVAGSAAFAANELAEGFVTKGQQLVVQSCRYDGDAASAKTTVDVVGARGGAQQGKTQIVEVATRTREAKERLQGLGLDLTEHGDADSLEVVLHGDADAATLRGAGFTYDVRIADLAAHTAANRAADAQYAAQVQESELPSGRTDVPPAAGLPARAQAARRGLSGAGEAHHAEVQDARGPRRHRHRDHPPPEPQGRQAGVREHGRPSRPRVAVVRARDGVRLRPR